MKEENLNKIVGIYKIFKTHSVDSHQISIYQSFNLQSNLKYSLKKIPYFLEHHPENRKFQENNQPNEQKCQLIANQVKCLKKIKGSQFLRCYHVLKTKNSCYYVYDYHPELSLRQLIDFINGNEVTEKSMSKINKIFNQGNLLSETEIYDFQKISIMMQLISCLEAIHSSGIIHNKFTGQNIYLSQQKNGTDDTDIKVFLGGFYESQKPSNFQSSQSSISRDVSCLANLIKSLKIFTEEKNTHDFRRKRMENFLQSIGSAKNNDILNLSVIKQNLQKMTTCEFSSVKVISLNESFGVPLGTKNENQSQTTSEGNLSCDRNNESDKEQKKCLIEVRSTQDSQKSEFSQKSRRNSQNPEIFIDEKKQEYNEYIHECEKVIRIAFKVCIFSIANKEKQFGKYFISLIENMLQSYKTKGCQIERRAFEKSLNELKKITLTKQYSEQVILSLQKNVMGRQKVSKLCNKLMRLYAEYQDEKILSNGCLLVEFLKILDFSESLTMRRKILTQIIRAKTRVDSLSPEQMKNLLSGRKRNGLSSSSKRLRSLSRSKQFLIG